MDDPITGRIVKALDAGRWVANVGLEAGVAPGERFVVFELGEEITDPETGASLGALELVKGHLVAEHVQPKMTILEREEEPEAAPRVPVVLSARLAQTDTGVPRRGSGRPRTSEPKVGDHVRRV